MWVVLATAILAFIETGTARRGFVAGFRKAINTYNTSSEAKRRVDILQIGFACCGLKGYSDWFKVAWYNTKYLDVYELGRI